MGCLLNDVRCGTAWRRTATATSTRSAQRGRARPTSVPGASCRSPTSTRLAAERAKANSDKLACKNDCDVATCCDEKTVPKETVEGDVGEAVKETEDVASKAEGAVEKILR
uniref:Uncharacterized protein n=1 Tax=Alexandrium monilatum TaxID=311494 RepID=A0A7S4SIX3_9DINO